MQSASGPSAAGYRSHRNDLALHSSDFGKADQLAPPVGKARDLDHGVDRRCNLRAGRARRGIDLIVTTSPSIPVISERLINLRRPSARRATWTTVWIADAICERAERGGISISS